MMVSSREKMRGTFTRIAFLQVINAIASARATLPSIESCGGVDPNHWTHAQESGGLAGYHVICFSQPQCKDSAEGDKCQADAAPVATTCRNGVREACVENPSMQTLISKSDSIKLLQIQEILEPVVINEKRFKKMKRALEKKKRDPLVFSFFSVSPDGSAPKPLTKTLGKTSGMIVAFEGGNFLWPGVEVGYRRNVTLPVEAERLAETLHLQLTTHSISPLVVEVSSFFTDAQCDHVIDKALPHMAKAPVAHMDHDVGKPDTNWRSSSNYFLEAGNDPILKGMDAQVSAMTRIPVTHQEYSQILRYEKGERYVSHHDYFDPDMYQDNQQIQELTKKGMYNRLATVFFYLSDVEAGGATHFPVAVEGGQDPNDIDFEDCTRGVSVKPAKGRIVIFYSQDAAARLDHRSLHAGCPVEKGTKWAANKWIWTKPMGYVRG
eukprot:TRINITY_DN108701_c0_g1_i1.p1 TRINITY_DN108701_c0_g1~~TRINITY_DN108701_c0_g1_i1.p1  ORF type:complete len:436 (-),score=79.91 TRINITY_DN108701_c0_g1_i1:304-1611(-)